MNYILSYVLLFLGCFAFCYFIVDDSTSAWFNASAGLSLIIVSLIKIVVINVQLLIDENFEEEDE